MYFIFKAPKWLEKEKRVSELLNEKKCRFCNLKENILHETNHFKFLKAKYPYAPQHLILLPKKHIPSLHFMDEEISKDFLNLIKKTGRKDICFMANYNFVAGQTLPHLHIHIIGELARNKFKRKINSPNLFYDPLTLPIIYEAGLEKNINGNGLVFCFDKNFQNETNLIFYKLEEGMRRIIEGKNKKIKLTDYGITKIMLKEMSMIYGMNEKKMNYIKHLVEQRFGGFGINWHLNYVYGNYIFMVVPRATILKKENEEVRWGGLEMFYNAQLVRELFTERELKEWEREEIKFINSIIKKV
jgi:diadenosine tetraphosphate (Ap4A) HIT family hydrolase